MTEPVSTPGDDPTDTTAAEPATGPARFRLSREELLTLGRVLELPADGFAGLLTAPVDWPSQEVARAALHGLVAREFLTVFDGGTVLDGRLAAMIELVAAPELVLRVQRAKIVPAEGPDDPPVGVLQTLFWFCRPEAAVEVVGDVGGVYELQEVPVSYVVGRVLAYTGLRPLDAVATGPRDSESELRGVPLAVPVPVLREAGPAADRGDLEGAAAALAPTVGADSAGALAAALAVGGHSFLVSSHYRLENGRIEGAVTAWLDAGDAGLWEVPSEPVDADDPDAAVTFTPASGQYLYDSIRAGLPQAA